MPYPVGRGEALAEPYPGAVRTRVQEVEGQPRWLQAARAGEAWAIDQFYRSHQPAVYALCRHLLGGTDDAEDAMQATFMAAIRALPGFRGGASLKTWLYRIAVREAMRLARRQGATHDAVDVEVVAPAVPPVEDRLAVRAALDLLRPNHRTVLVLRYWEELSYGEMAQVLGVPVAVVSMRLSRARAEFQKHFEAEP